jgi:hypothetical protein
MFASSLLLAASLAQLYASSAPAAADALVVLKELAADPKRPNQFGFASAAEVADAALGKPRAVYSVERKNIQKYGPGKDPSKLLGEPDEVIYPVVVKDQIRAAISLTKSGSGWKVASFTDPALALALVRAGSQEDYFVIRIPYLGCIVAAWREENRLWVVPIPQVHANYGSPEWVPVLATDFFQIMAPRAKPNFRGPGG